MEIKLIKQVLFIGLFLPMMTIGLCAKGQDLENRVDFVNKEGAIELLTTEDEYTDCWSQFDIDSRMQKQQSTKAELFEFVAGQVRDWSDEERAKIDSIFLDIDREINLREYRLNIPDEILMVKTTLLEEGGAAAYTRGNYIVLGEKLLEKPQEEIKPVVIHELFHVLSRHDEIFRNQMYALIGFDKMNEIKYPKSIANTRITNPDAPQTDYYITLKKGEKSMDCLMVLFADRPYDGGSFFQYLQFGFMRLEGEQTKSVYLKDGNPEIFKVDEVTDFYEQVGQNTKYIIHPEEIMADNFSFAIMDKKDLPSAWLVQNIQKSMKE